MAQAGWTPNEEGLWHAHLGARNAVHHFSSTAVALHGDGARDARLTWELERHAITELSRRSQRQAHEYTVRLAGQPVVTNLRVITSRVSADVP